MYSSKKFNSVMFLVLFLIAFIGGYFIAYEKLDDYANASDGEVVVEPDDDTLEGETSVINADAPSEDATAYERLDYAFFVLSDGIGYTSYMSQRISIVGQIQNIAMKRYRGKNYDLTEEFYLYDGLFDFGKNEFATYYSDGTNVLSKRFSDKTQYDFTNKTYNYPADIDNIKRTTVTEWESRQLKINSFFTTVTDQNSTVITYDKKARGKTYYTIKVNLDPNKLDEKFLKLIASFGISNLKINSIIMEFKIDKTTGYLQSYTATAQFSATWGITANVSLDMKETYFTMNRSAEDKIRDVVSQSFNVNI